MKIIKIEEVARLLLTGWEISYLEKGIFEIKNKKGGRNLIHKNTIEALQRQKSIDKNYKLITY